MTISQRLFGKLNEMSITQTELAKGTGISPKTISAWQVKGTNPSADKIASICDFIGVDTDWLLTGKNRINTLSAISNTVSGNNILGSNYSSVVVNKGGQECILSDDASEILRIVESLDPKRRHKLRGVAYELEEEMKGE